MYSNTIIYIYPSKDLLLSIFLLVFFQMFFNYRCVELGYREFSIPGPGIIKVGGNISLHQPTQGSTP